MTDIQTTLEQAPKFWHDGITQSLYKIHGKSIVNLAIDKEKIMNLVHLIILKRFISQKDVNPAYFNVKDDLLLVLKSIEENKEKLAK